MSKFFQIHLTASVVVGSFVFALAYFIDASFWLLWVGVVIGSIAQGFVDSALKRAGYPMEREG